MTNTPSGDLASRNFVVTGANTGIGKETVRVLARRGASVVLACRSADKTNAVIDELRRETGNDRLEFASLDLASLASVRACAAELLRRDRPIHVLINNAGLASVRGQTKDGFELAFGTNHLGHFLFTMLLLERLKESAPARIVNVASTAHYKAKGIDWEAVRQPTRTFVGLHEYEVSKLANVLFTKELARRLPKEQVTAYALHPGVIASDIWQRRMPRPLAWIAKRFMDTPEDGARTSVYCATSPEVAEHSGRYYDSEKEKRPNQLADDAELARTLWEKSAAWTEAAA